MVVVILVEIRVLLVVVQVVLIAVQQGAKEIAKKVAARVVL